MKKVIIKKSLKEYGDDIDSPDMDYGMSFDGNDVEKAKMLLYRALKKKGISTSRIDVFVNSIFYLIEMLIQDKFSMKSMNILNKVIEIVKKRLQ